MEGKTGFEPASPLLAQDHNLLHILSATCPVRHQGIEPRTL